MEEAFMDILETITKYDGCGIKFQVDKEQGLHQNLAAANAFLQLNHYAQYLPAVFEEVVKGTAVALVGASSPIGLTIVGIDASYSVYKTYTKSNNVDQTIGRAGIEVGKPIMFAIMEDTISQAWKVPKYIFVVVESGITVLINNQFRE